MSSFFLVLLVSSLLSLTLFLLMLLLGKKSDLDMEKQAPFECGFLSYEESRCPFSTHFFIVGLIFLIFDVELILLFPYLASMTLIVQSLSQLSIICFLTVLSVGLVIEWEKSMLEWAV